MANKTGSPILRQAFQQIRNKVQYRIRKLRADYYSKTMEQNKGNLRKTWKVLKQALNKDVKVTKINQINHEGNTISEEKTISNTFNNYFVSVGDKLAHNIPSSSYMFTEYLSKAKNSSARFEVKKIQATDVRKILGTLKNGKASGLDSMSNKFLKIAKETIAPSLCDIFNCSIKSKIYPHDFKIAIVTPIFKGGETDELGNYRPISVLSTVARVFEKILYNQLYDYLTKHNILGDKQWGFRSLHSTALALIDCSNNWLVNIDRGGINTTVLLDIKKAFDTIDHEILLRKLDYYGIKNDDLQFLKSYLNKRQQSCKVNNHTSSLKEITLGVPQGSILGPLLFIVFMNDLPHCVKNTDVTMYADDTSATTAIRDLSDITSQVIPNLIKISDWLKANRLNLNTLKTEFMLIGTNWNLSKIGDLLALRISNDLIKRVHKAKYLGLVIDDKLSWKQHIGYISTKIR